MTPIEEVRRWVERVVVGLDLCPFARSPLESDSIRMVESRAEDEAALLAELLQELELLEADEPEAETTLIVIPDPDN